MVAFALAASYPLNGRQIDLDCPNDMVDLVDVALSVPLDSIDLNAYCPSLPPHHGDYFRIAAVAAAAAVVVGVAHRNVLVSGQFLSTLYEQSSHHDRPVSNHGAEYQHSPSMTLASSHDPMCLMHAAQSSCAGPAIAAHQSNSHEAFVYPYRSPYQLLTMAISPFSVFSMEYRRHRGR